MEVFIYFSLCLLLVYLFVYSGECQGVNKGTLRDTNAKYSAVVSGRLIVNIIIWERKVKKKRMNK